ncbi:flagellar hook-length control protein FliK [Paenibacillus lentus]|uniref:Flagellar hook-length control protein FliK n=1 Tax=Paenibacillus lentus TaxID=1338368 RepID=A0A3Q8SCY3_9BACL|nr:flagellar hook-length control protein FliK [Paenibacillus lentus]AZK47792.1 flagellar hook-length control protein FliK [Paenibacillus lentus]
MSQIITNLSLGNPANGILLNASGRGEAVQVSGKTFDQTLVAMLLGNGSSTEGANSLQSLAMLGLTNSSEQETNDEELQNLNPVIENLLGQLNELDQALEDNPSLMLVLQNWLVGVQMIMQPQSGEVAIENGAETIELPALAQHPETMRFAIQDTLVQLMRTSEQTPLAPQSGLLLQVLQQVLGSPQANSQPTDQAAGGNLANNSWTSALEKNIQVIMNGSSNQTTGNGAQQQAHTPAFQIAMANNAGQNSAQASPLNNTVAVDYSAGVESADHTDNGLHTGTVMTAGQLAMREAANSPLKPLTSAAPAVPVEQFGKEISGFLVNKFEIVKLQGMSQARISLYPEHLGQVDVKITMQNGQLIAQFVTEHAFARESLEGQMAQLRSALQAQGLQVSKLEVTQNSSLSSHMYQDGRQQSSDSHQQQNNKRREVREDDVLALGDLNEEWNEWISEVRAREEHYGSSFVARV